MTLHKVLKYLAIVIGVLGAILLGRIWWAGDEDIAGSADLQTSMIEPMIWVAYFVFAVIVVLVLVSVIKNLFKGNVKNTFISIGAFVVIVFIAYMLADGNRPPGLTGEQGMTESDFRWVSTGLITFYILAAIAVGSMIFSGIKKLAK